MISIKKPPIHPFIMPDESPAGYVSRLAELNHYAHPRWLIEVKSTGRYITRPKNLLESLSALEWTGTKRHNWIDVMPKVSDRLVHHLKIAVCPKCLSEFGYWKIQWHFRFTISCAMHKAYLVYLCDHCNNEFRMPKVNLHSCQCGKKFEEMKIVSAGHNVSKLMEYLDIVPLKINTPVEKELLGKKLLKRMIFVKAALDFLPMNTSNKRKSKAVRQDVDALANMMYEGKGSFDRLLTEVIERSKLNYYTKYKDPEYLKMISLD